MVVSWGRFLVAGLALLPFALSISLGDGPTETSAWRLKREVEERERQSTRAQRELAEVRARLALAEGKRDEAIIELRKVVAGYQGEIQWIREHANWFCDPREPMTEAQWEMAKARAWLAEIEGDGATLVAELKKIVGFHEERLQAVRRLEQRLAVKPDEAVAEKESLEKARKRLQDAEKRYSTEQSKKAEGSQ